MTKDEALKLALEALESKYIVNCGAWRVQQDQAITAIRKALAQPEHSPDCALLKIPSKDCDCQPEQEPVAGQPLPCPFCGHIGLDFSDGNTYRWGIASCGGCGASCGEIRREYPDEGKWHSEAIAEWNRRTTPPQPEQNQFNPDWDAMAVMVEKQQRMAKRIEELEAHRKPLTWERVLEIGLECSNDHSRLPFEVKVARAVEASHGIKE